MNKNKFKQETKNQLNSLTSIFKKNHPKRKSQYSKVNAKNFDEQFYNSAPPSSRKKVKVKKEIVVISRGESLIQCFLKKHLIDFKREMEFKDMISPAGGYMKMDFYLPERNMCIEFDGIQHFKPSKKFDTAKCTLETRQANDRCKDAYCRAKNITMLRINYKQMKDVYKILEEVLLKTPSYSGKS